MNTELSHLTLVLWVHQMGVPLLAVLEEEAHYERLTARLLAAHGDALDIVTANTTTPERALILRAAALLRVLLAHPTPPEE